MVNFNLIISIITLNINGPKNPMKRQTLSDWIRKLEPTKNSLFKHTNTNSGKAKR